MSNLKKQVDQLLNSVQIHFPKNGQKLVVYLLFYKRYCTLIQHGYISNLSTKLIKNSLTEVSKDTKNGKHIFKTLLNFNNDISPFLFDVLKDFTSSIIENNIENYDLKVERKFETILYYFSNIDILSVSDKDFGALFKEILLDVYKDEFYENKKLNEFLVTISRLNDGEIFINNPKLGNIILDTLPIIEENFSLFHIKEEDSFIAQMNLIMNGFYSFNFSEKNISTVIIHDKILDNSKLLSSIGEKLTQFSSSEQLLFTLPLKQIVELKFDKDLLKKLVSVIKFDKDLGILIFKQNCQKNQDTVSIIDRFFEYEIQNDVIEVYQDFIQKGLIQEKSYFRIEQVKDIIKNSSKIDLNEKEPKSYIQSINDNFEDLSKKIKEIDDTEISKRIKLNIDSICDLLNKKIVLPDFNNNLKWENLFIFLNNELQNLKSKKIEVISNFQNLTLLDLKINPNLFRNLFQYIDYNLSEDNLCRVEFNNLKQKNKIRVSLFSSINTLFDGYIEQINFISEIHNGFIKKEKKHLQSNGFYKLINIDIPYAKELKQEIIEKLVKNEITGVLEKKDIYLISDEIGNDNIIRGLNIQDIINSNLSGEEALTIQKLRFQSSLEIFVQKKSEATTKTTSFKIELPKGGKDEIMINYIYQEIENRNWSISNDDKKNDLITISLKADSPPSPSKIVDFFNKFHNSKRLKYITHDYDIPNSKFDYDIFLKEAEEEFETIIQTIEVHPRLEILIREFAFKKPINRIANKSDLGWKNKDIKEWCAKNPNKHPINNTQFSKELFDTFKNKIEVREKMLVTYLKNSIKQKLGQDLYERAQINFDKELDMTTFYTNVEYIFAGIRDLFAPIKERIIENPYVDIYVVDHFDNIYSASIEIVILHRNSFANKATDNPNLFKGDLLSAKKKFEGFCDWSIQSKFKNGCYRLNILKDNDEIPEKVSLEESNIKGFSHHLTFYI